jgi:hypothetical protein
MLVGYASPARVDGVSLPGWLYHGARVLRQEAESAAGGSVRVRHLEREGHRPFEQLADAAATLVVIGGRPPERGLPGRSVAPWVPAEARLPIVVAA